MKAIASNLQKKSKRSKMTDEECVQYFQRKLYRKAKQEKKESTQM
jgi:hypothetical protein